MQTDRTGQDRAEQSRAGQDKTGQDRTRQTKSRHGMAWQNRTGRTVQGRHDLTCRQDRNTEQGIVGRDRTGDGSRTNDEKSAVEIRV
jgi:hypothetical protein